MPLIVLKDVNVHFAHMFFWLCNRGLMSDVHMICTHDSGQVWEELKFTISQASIGVFAESLLVGLEPPN